MIRKVPSNQREAIIRVLLDFKVEYWESGKNVTEGAINIQCPFCEDHSNHLGIFPEDGRCHCWRCNESCSLIYLFQVLLKIPKFKAKELLQAGEVNFKRDALEQIESFFDLVEEVPVKKEIKELVFPPHMEKITEEMNYPLLDKYLERRKLLRSTLIKHHCSVCRVGPSMSRMIIPIISKGEIVAYQGADLTGKAQIKYQTSINDINDYLYGYDDIWEGKTMILTEGILDAWRIDKDSVCHFGTSLTKTQQRLILNKDLNRLVFCWDGDAYWKAVEAADYFLPFIPYVHVVAMPSEKDDPNSLGHEKIWELINEEIGNEL